MSKFAQIIKANILRVMSDSRVTQTELAARTGIARPNLSSILNGDREIQTDTVQKIADSLGVNVSELALDTEVAVH